VLAPRGLASMVAMFFAGRLIGYLGERTLIACGILLVLVGTWVFTWYSPQVNTAWIIWPATVQGLGLGLVFVPLATLTFATLPDALSAEAAGVRQLVRTIGASMGIAMGTMVMADQTQSAWNRLGGHITPFTGPALHRFLAPFHLSPADPRAGVLLGEKLGHQAHFIGLLHAFGLLAVTIVIGLPLLPLLRGKAPA